MINSFRLIKALSRPEYIYRPNQFYRRVRHSLQKPKGPKVVRTSSGLPIFADLGEVHGRVIATLGIVDLRVSEMVFRLLEPGDCAVDVGANIGAISVVMASRVGRSGSIFAFEPHPKTRSLLFQTVDAWQSHYGFTNIAVDESALSNRPGTARLFEPRGFRENSGLAHLDAGDNEEGGYTVKLTTFDTRFLSQEKIRLVKLDVEGHEDLILEGMRRCLRSRSIETIIFEEKRSLPSKACDVLSSFGYRSFMIDRDFRGPRLVDVAGSPSLLRGEATSVLATIRPDILMVAKRRGWFCLQKYRSMFHG